jgi:hypothetical protein
VTIANSTISNNSSISFNQGGGVFLDNPFSPLDVTIVNTTISGNTSSTGGGGIMNNHNFEDSSTIRLDNVTIVNNASINGTGGGVSSNGGDIFINQSIISGNTSENGPEINVSNGTVTVDNYNLFGLDNDPGTVGVSLGDSDIIADVANLSDIIDINLTDNGGLTPTHALVVGSPAIDALPSRDPCQTEVDQTGKSRAIDGDGDGSTSCDIGAFENDEPIEDEILKNGFEGGS